MRALSLLVLPLVVACTGDLSDKFSPLEDPVAVANPADLTTPVKTDTIVQVTTPKVDVLWVIDDSCSMYEEQRKLAANFPSFIEFFLDSGLDWHIGVVSTDTSAPSKSGKLQGAGPYRFVDTSTPQPAEVFAGMATLGTNGSVTERGRRAAFLALTDPLVSGFNQDFYREEASLHVVVISDENDFSGSSPTRNEFISFLQTLKPDPEMVTFSSIVGPVNGCADADPGTEYIAVTNAVGGIHESICAEDWAPVLEELGLQAAGLRTEYFLSELPVPGTLDVRILDGDFVWVGMDQDALDAGATVEELCPVGSCFRYRYNDERNAIVLLDLVPGPLAQIEISYELLGGYQPDGDGETPWSQPADTDVP